MIAHLPPKRRISSLGWYIGNAVCCHHRGHRPDTRGRGNFLFVPDGTIAYNCYNCGFKTVFDKTHIGRNFESLMVWMGISQENINQIKLDLLRVKLEGTGSITNIQDIRHITDFKEVPLPIGAMPFENIIDEEEVPKRFVNVVEYLYSRGNAIANGWDYYWSPVDKWDLNNRIIIPFYQRNKIVGWTARYAGTPPKDIPRYYNSGLQPGYLFNCDILNNHDRDYVLVAEGPFDAIALSGIGTLGSELSEQQILWLNSTDADKIIVPDRQRKNQGLIDTALELGWYVSFPDWEDDVKDAADAARKYGRLFTIRSVIAAKSNSKLHIGIKRQMFR